MKTAIVYYSKHHENTRKLLDAIKKSSAEEVTLIDALKNPAADLTGYDIIGFASGIYYSKFHKSVLQIAKEQLPEKKKVFFIYTYGAKRDGYTKAIRETVSGKNAAIAGEYGCPGFNTFGPFKLIGGIAKNHPDQDDIKGAVAFYQGILN